MSTIPRGHEGLCNEPEVIISSPFPSHHEISLPNNEIIVDYGDFLRRSNDRIDQDVETQSHYDKIDIHIQPSDGECKPKSVYTRTGSEQNPKLEVSSREVSTRQCKFEIGEEMEYFKTTKTRESQSCPPSPLAGQRSEPTNVKEVHDNPGYSSSSSEPGTENDSERKKDETGKPKEGFPFHYLFTSTSSPPTKVLEHLIIPNPYNKLNQRFHSTLQCPCFLFFFFLCCLPAVHFMQQSDHQFKKGNRDRVQIYAKRSLFFYVVGSIVGVVFLSVAIFFAVDYVKQFV